MSSATSRSFELSPQVIVRFARPTRMSLFDRGRPERAGGLHDARLGDHLAVAVVLQVPER